MTKRHRIRDVARSRAYTRLVQAHLDEFRAVYQAHVRVMVGARMLKRSKWEYKDSASEAEMKARKREQRRAQQYAKQELRREHPDEYRRYVEEEYGALIL